MAETNAKLAKAQAELKEVTDKLDALRKNYDESVKKQQELTADIELCKIKLDNAVKLIDGLSGERERWNKEVVVLEDLKGRLPGNILIASGMVAYCGPFVGQYRADLQETWQKAVEGVKIPYSDGVTLVDALTDPVKLLQWQVCGLPKDNVSTENGLIIGNSRRWCLCIDPQRQANKYLKNLGKQDAEAGMDLCKLSQPKFLQTLELGVQFGKWVLLENIGEHLDPALEPILLQQKTKDSGGYVIKLGDKTVQYDEKFTFFMTTTLPNPHYSPEVSVKVTLVNFAITKDGLQDQMIGIAVLQEMPELEQAMTEIVTSAAEGKAILKKLEDEILRLLVEAGDRVLESVELIQTLEVSNKTSSEINTKLADGEKTKKEIEETRKFYVPYAFRAAVLFFCTDDMRAIDPMYQFSLQWFQELAKMSIDNAPRHEEMEGRIQNLTDHITYAVYNNVCRGLFMRHKLLFSLLMCIKIVEAQGGIDAQELRFLMTGPTAQAPDTLANPDESWIGSVQWNEIRTLSEFPAFKGLDEDFCNPDSLPGWKSIYDAVEAHQEPLPGKWNDELSSFQKLCFLRCIRQDKVVPAMVAYVSEQIGGQFVDPPSFDIAISYADSTKYAPLIFILSQGSDPTDALLRLADDMGMGKDKLDMISLGQGQGPKAARMIESARQTGSWVLLSNCHLCISWMSELERICEALSSAEDIHNDFRLWLTSMPSKDFPALLLQNGVKMTNEPPKGLRANLVQSFTAFNDRELDSSKKPEVFKPLLFGFCFFHAIVQDRRKYGPIGWNIPYGFTMEDLVTCKRQLQYFVDEYDFVPYKVLNFLGAKINYGGRVTDAIDKRLAECILKKYIVADLVERGPDYKFSKSGLYYCPKAENQEEFMTYLKTLPLDPKPEAFGMSSNCEITCAEAETALILENLLSMAPKSGGGGGVSAEDQMDAAAENVMNLLMKI